MRKLITITVLLGFAFLSATSAMSFTLTEDFSSATIYKSDLTTTSGLNQWNDLARWQTVPTGGNPDAWAQHTPNSLLTDETSLLFYGWQSEGIDTGMAFSLDFDFINESRNGIVYIGGLKSTAGLDRISRFAPWNYLGDTFIDSQSITGGVSAWASASTFSGIIDDDYDVLYIAFQMGGAGDVLRGIDNVNLQVGETAPVPEPSTVLLLGSGLVGLAWYGRKRQQKTISR